jgi:DNA-binding response OmpR family regulator
LEATVMARILLVDDDDVFRYAIQRLLISEGYEVAEARDFRRALDVIEDREPLALLITDIVLPSVNGFALARMARMHHLEMPVIYVTGLADVPADEARGPVMHKPFLPEELLAQVQMILSQPATGPAGKRP